jgi:uncharacterized membrane protein YeaQ/YmgE (transglycosylase-associated protein family)
MTAFATFNTALLILQEAGPAPEPLLLYPMYLLILGAAAGAAAQRLILRQSSPWSVMFLGVVGSLVGGYLGRGAFGNRDIALSGGLAGAVLALAVRWAWKRLRASDPPQRNDTANFDLKSPPPASPRPQIRDAIPSPSSDPSPRKVPSSSHPSAGDIFISYASADRPFAQQLANTLQNEGWSVWWDRAIPPGKTFDAVIEEALDGAKCVVVLWSKSSVASDWVKVEAAEAARRRILIPALIDNATIPLEFRRIQAASLVDWTGSSDHSGFQSLTTSVRELLGAPR